ncbi:MAG: IS66 family insertion sequence element accessory protein TnpB [Myxococcota bacterium]|nr:IS66 family insertion sequence element accessory protein TnpB [Myxococcota bacterium]
MIQITPQMRILVAVAPADFRCGIDGLTKVCRKVLRSDPFSGTVFVFRNRRRTAVKILIYDGQGFWLCHKRLSAKKFVYWPSSEEEAVTELEVLELSILLSGGDPVSAQAAPLWRRVRRAEITPLGREKIGEKKKRNYIDLRC